MEYSWRFLVEKSPAHVNSYHFLRKPEVQAAYDTHLSDVLKNYETLRDFVLVRLMGFTGFATQGPHGSHKIMALMNEDTPTKWVKVTNTFPYNVEANIEHYVVFTNENSIDLDLVEKKVSELFPDVEKSRLHMFVNEPRLQSINTVFHVHVFVNSQKAASFRFQTFIDTILI